MNNTLPVSLPVPSSNKQPFFKMTAEQAREDYKQKLITAEAYILYILKAHRSAGWKWTFSVKDFCSLWEIKERTFYYALSKLKTKKLINWQAEGRVTLWWGADIGSYDSSVLDNPSTSCTVGSPQSVAEAVQPIAPAMQDVAEKMQSVAVDEQSVANKLHCIAQDELESITVQGFQEPIYIQRETDSTESVSLPLTPSQEPPAIAPLGGASPATVLNEEEMPRDAEVPQIKLTDEELKSHLAAAVKGVMPSGDVIGQLLDSDYCVGFRQAARVHNWDLGQLSQSEIPAHLKEQMRSLREKVKRRRF